MIIRRLTALVAVALLVSACSTAAAGDPTADGEGGELGATTWVLQSYLANGALTIVPDDLFVDAEFRSSRVTGFSACNTYDALYRTGGRTAADQPDRRHAAGLRRPARRPRGRLSGAPRAEPVLQRQSRRPDDPRGGPDGPSGLSRCSGQSAPRPMGRECLRDGAGHHDRAARRHLADRRLRPVQGRRLLGLQHLHGSLHDQRHGRRDRAARVDPDGLRR